MSTEITKKDTTALHPMTIADLVQRTMLLQQAMKNVMKEGQHFSKIPGCGDKPVLLKSGAEKLANLFQLVPEFITEIIELENGHREYRIKCRMYNMSGVFLGEGVGSASTKESKWAYRWDVTNNEVPKDYWKHRDQTLLGGVGYIARKVKSKGADKWYIFKRTEIDNATDYYNTCLKMAKKRAQVDATLTITAASDLFEQDLEDLQEKEQSFVPEEKKESKFEKSTVTTNEEKKENELL